MAILNREELSAKITQLLGDRTDDDALSVLEDVNDTLNDYDSRMGTDWKSKFEENDASWRKRYLDRFRGIESEEEQRVETFEERGEKLTFEELFKEEI